MCRIFDFEILAYWLRFMGLGGVECACLSLVELSGRAQPWYRGNRRALSHCCPRTSISRILAPP